MPRDSYPDDYNSHDSRYRDYPRNDYPRQHTSPPPLGRSEGRPTGHGSYDREPGARSGWSDSPDQFEDPQPPRRSRRRDSYSEEAEDGFEDSPPRRRRHENNLQASPPSYDDFGDTRGSQRTAERDSRPRNPFEHLHNPPDSIVVPERPLHRRVMNRLRPNDPQPEEPPQKAKVYHSYAIGPKERRINREENVWVDQNGNVQHKQTWPRTTRQPFPVRPYRP